MEINKKPENRPTAKELREEKKAKKAIEKELKEKIESDLAASAEELSVKDVFDAIKSLDFYKSESDECLDKSCENPSSTGGYCRFHYIALWSDIKKKQKVLEEGKLQELIMILVDKYPLKFIENIISDLVDDKSFYQMLKDMDIDANEESYSDAEEGDDDDQDIAYETKSGSKPSFDD